MVVHAHVCGAENATATSWKCIVVSELNIENLFTAPATYFTSRDGEHAELSVWNKGASHEQ
jgi:hypothetical protein